MAAAEAHAALLAQQQAQVAFYGLSTSPPRKNSMGIGMSNVTTATTAAAPQSVPAVRRVSLKADNQARLVPRTTHTARMQQLGVEMVERRKKRDQLSIKMRFRRLRRTRSQRRYSQYQFIFPGTEPGLANVDEENEEEEEEDSGTDTEYEVMPNEIEEITIDLTGPLKSDLELKSLAALTLGNLAADSPVMRERLHSPLTGMDFLTPIVRLLAVSNESATGGTGGGGGGGGGSSSSSSSDEKMSKGLVQNACFAISNMARMPNGQPERILSSGAVQLILQQLMIRQDPEWATELFWPLAYLTVGTEESVQSMFNAGLGTAISMHIQLMVNSGTLAIPMLRVVGNITGLFSVSITDVLLSNAQFLPSLLRYVHPPHPSTPTSNGYGLRAVQKEALFVISQIAASSSFAHIQALIESNVIPALAGIVASEGYDLRKEAAAGLVSISTAVAHQFPQSFTQKLWETMPIEQLFPVFVDFVGASDQELVVLGLRFLQLAIGGDYGKNGRGSSFSTPSFAQSYLFTCLQLPLRLVTTVPSGRTETLLWPASASATPGTAKQAPRLVVLVIPGNPGVADFYTRYLSSLSRRLDAASPHTAVDIYAISYLNHSAAVDATEPSSSLEEFNDGYQRNGCVADHMPPIAAKGVSEKKTTKKSVFSLAEQIQHKIEVFDYLVNVYPPDTKFVLMGHSIGAYVCECVLAARPNSNIVKIVQLFPAIMHIRDTPNGNRLWWLFTSFAGVILPLMAFMLHLVVPRWLLIKLASSSWLSGVHDVHSATIVIDRLIRCKNGTAIRNCLAMSRDEMNTLHEPNLDFYREHADRIHQYYGVQDGWVPLKYRDIVQEALAETEAAVQTCELGMPHAFCLDRSEDMAALTAEWLTKLL
ncbi:ARM repeat-containing protein [Ramicandelaber brevisporus]|nr:ARM repeat-containing protein [Ramicandelaber brevisporus]